MFVKNESNADRIGRAVLAVVLSVLGFSVLSGVWSIVAYVLAAVMLVTGAVGFCPLYVPFKIDTTKRKEK